MSRHTSFDDVIRGSGLRTPAPSEFPVLLDRLATLSAANVSRYQGLGEMIAAESDKITARWNTHLQDNASPELRAEIGRSISRDIRAAREKIMSTDGAMPKHTSELKKIRDRLSLAVSTYSSPVELLTSAGLGSEKRTRYTEQLASASPAELRTHATRAIADNDLELGAAVLTSNNKLPNRQRAFRNADFASRLVGDQHEAMVHASKTAALAVDDAVARRRELETGKRPSALDKLSRGLRAHILNPPEDPSADIAAGLRVR